MRQSILDDRERRTHAAIVEVLAWMREYHATLYQHEFMAKVVAKLPSMWILKYKNEARIMGECFPYYTRRRFCKIDNKGLIRVNLLP